MSKPETAETPKCSEISMNMAKTMHEAEKHTLNV